METSVKLLIFILCALVDAAAVGLFFLTESDKLNRKAVILISAALVICATVLAVAAAASKTADNTQNVTGPGTDAIAETEPGESGAEEVGESQTEETTQNAYPVTAERYDGGYSDVNGALAGIDDLGRVIPENAEKKDGKTVGIFYFYGSGGNKDAHLYDVNKILEKDPLAYESLDRWAAAGGPYNESCYYGEPLFGYYGTQDEWVVGRHAMMLAATGVDYIIFDATNGPQNMETIEVILKVLDKYYQMGVNVPRVAFYTHTNAELTATVIYNRIYKPNRDKYAHLWYNWDGKPLMITDPDGNFPEGFRDFFTIKDSVWPTDTVVSRNAWPWMEFDRMYTRRAVYGRDGRKEILSVSPAQHCDTVMFSQTAWYGGNDHTRSWHNGENDPSPDAYLYGYNFAEQWEWALQQNTESVFVTGFNEWCAVVTRFSDKYGPVQMCDNATMNCSRDVEPMKGGYGDNYLMQLAYYIRQYKGCEGRVYVGEDKTVDINGSFAQFDGATAVYTDPAGDTGDRDHAGWGTYYTDTSGRNDIETVKVIKNTNTVYFYIRTANALTEPSDSGWMTLFIDTGADGGYANAYDVAVNRTAPKDGRTPVEYYENGEWKLIGYANVRYEGCEMMIEIDRGLIYCESAGGLWDIRFKVADNYVDGDYMSFYTAGDCAPYGRFNFVFSEKK